MTLAEIHNKKLSKNSEDLLTANVFTVFRYLPATWGIYAFLKTIPGLGDRLPEPAENEEVTTVIHFWPLGLKRNREPDLLLGLQIGSRSIYIVVEVKYRSGASDKDEKQGIGEDGNSYKRGNQLADQLCDLHHGEYKIFCQGQHNQRLSLKNNKEDRFLLYLTLHAIKPQEEISRAEKQYDLVKQNLFWTNWYAIYDYFVQLQSEELTFPYREIVDDTSLLLRKKSFSTFQGFDDLISVDLAGIKGCFWQDTLVTGNQFQGIRKPPSLLFNKEAITGSFWHGSLI